MMGSRETVAVVGAAGAAEITAYLTLHSTLASLAAFGSVIGLGVLYFRARKARLAPAPSELNAKPRPAATQRRDETFIAVAELRTRIDDLQRTLDHAATQMDALLDALDAREEGIERRLARLVTARLDVEIAPLAPPVPRTPRMPRRPRLE